MSKRKFPNKKLATCSSDFIPKAEKQIQGLDSTECELVAYVSDRYEVPDPPKDKIEFQKHKIMLRKDDLTGIVHQKQHLVIGFFTDNNTYDHSFENMTVIPNLDMRVVNEQRILNMSNLRYDVEEGRWIGRLEFVDISYTLQLPTKVGDRACYQFPIFIKNCKKSKKKRWFQVLRIKSKSDGDVEGLSADLEGLNAESRNCTVNEEKSLFHSETEEMAMTEKPYSQHNPKNVTMNATVASIDGSGENQVLDKNMAKSVDNAKSTDKTTNEISENNPERISTEELVTQHLTENIPCNTEDSHNFSTIPAPNFSNVFESTRLDGISQAKTQHQENKSDSEAPIQIEINPIEIEVPEFQSILQAEIPLKTPTRPRKSVGSKKVIFSNHAPIYSDSEDSQSEKILTNTEAQKVHQVIKLPNHLKTRKTKEIENYLPSDKHHVFLATLPVEFQDVTLQNLKRRLKKRSPLSESVSELQTVTEPFIRFKLKCPVSGYPLDKFPVRYENSKDPQPLSGTGLIELKHSKLKKKQKPMMMTKSNSLPLECPNDGKTKGRVMVQDFLLEYVFSRIPIGGDFAQAEVSIDDKNRLSVKFLTAKDIGKLKAKDLSKTSVVNMMNIKTEQETQKILDSEEVNYSVEDMAETQHVRENEEEIENQNLWSDEENVLAETSLSMNHAVNGTIVLD